MGAKLTKAMQSCCFATMLFVANSALAAQATHSPTGAMSTPNSNHSRPPAKWTEEQRALHALNRLTFGPRPGDLQKVMDMDVIDWIEQQLHPE